MTPDSAGIQVVVRDENKKMKDYLHCDLIDSITFFKDNQTMYAIMMDDMGLYANNPVNKCASKLLLKIKRIKWGVPMLTGWYAVCKYIYDEEGNERQVDMDMTPKEFVQFCQNCRSDITGA